MEMQGASVSLMDRPKPKNVVERAIAMFDGPSEFGRRLSVVAGKEISRQAVHNWRVRGGFSRDIIPAVHQLTKISYVDLLTSAVYDE